MKKRIRRIVILTALLMMGQTVDAHSANTIFFLMGLGSGAFGGYQVKEYLDHNKDVDRMSALIRREITDPVAGYLPGGKLITSEQILSARQQELDQFKSKRTRAMWFAGASFGCTIVTWAIAFTTGGNKKTSEETEVIKRKKTTWDWDGKFVRVTRRW